MCTLMCVLVTSACTFKVQNIKASNNTLPLRLLRLCAESMGGSLRLRKEMDKEGSSLYSIPECMQDVL